MDKTLIHRFRMLWKGFFPNEELPIVFFHCDETCDAQPIKAIEGQHCVLDHIARVRAGQALYFVDDTASCNGARLYFGFGANLRPFHDTFPSCGMPGKISGERVVVSGSETAALNAAYPGLPQRRRYLICKPWSALRETDIPEVVVFFPQPDALSGLMTLVHGPGAAPDTVASLYCSGCSSLVYHPGRAVPEHGPQAFIGMLDMKARHYIEAGAVSFALPWHAFITMAERMEDNVLVSDVWKSVRTRMDRNSRLHSGD
ncbi:MAG: DUF169 domain-containing protein [Ignavibacteriae bacterium]|nr:DUF169 domain-containing protein [Ignavibacteriota bacterium]